MGLLFSECARDEQRDRERTYARTTQREIDRLKDRQDTLVEELEQLYDDRQRMVTMAAREKGANWSQDRFILMQLRDIDDKIAFKVASYNDYSRQIGDIERLLGRAVEAKGVARTAALAASTAQIVQSQNIGPRRVKAQENFDKRFKAQSEALANMKKVVQNTLHHKLPASERATEGDGVDELEQEVEAVASAQREMMEMEAEIEEEKRLEELEQRLPSVPGGGDDSFTERFKLLKESPPISLDDNSDDDENPNDDDNGDNEGRAR
jgi:hypothetical protein